MTAVDCQLLPASYAPNPFLEPGKGRVESVVNDIFAPYRHGYEPQQEGWKFNNYLFRKVDDHMEERFLSFPLFSVESACFLSVFHAVLNRYTEIS